jgi:hypothetical protein
MEIYKYDVAYCGFLARRWVARMHTRLLNRRLSGVQDVRLRCIGRMIGNWCCWTFETNLLEMIDVSKMAIFGSVTL